MKNAEYIKELEESMYIDGVLLDWERLEQVGIVGVQTFQTVDNDRRTVCVLGGELPDDRDTSCDRIASLLYFHDCRDDTLQICFDAVCVYRQLVMREVRAFQRYIRGEEEYKTYKYR